ncbi:Transmembrane protein 218 [Chionoecetes opilio]|uniref:Transmembrane protein 218 n=1 Tax=Chionoecetes opilio TaxID=41210 RepID=A0A8J5CZ37_CHIOP|nr:Transmembrane protein 218 [Chionoecetes opilio]
MLVLGVGAGVILLAVLWVVAGVVLLACTHRSSVGGVGITLVAAVLSLALLLLPQHSSPHQPVVEIVATDQLFIPRVVILLVLALSVLAGLGAVVVHWMDPILARPLKKVKL